jgi:hypothetical protein
MSSMARTALVAALLVGTVGYSEGFALGGTPALVGGKLRHVLYRPRSMRGMLRGLRAQVQPGTSTDEASAGLVQREIIGTPMKGPASNPHELSVQQKVYLWLTTLVLPSLLRILFLHFPPLLLHHTPSHTYLHPRAHPPPDHDAIFNFRKIVPSVLALVRISLEVPADFPRGAAGLQLLMNPKCRLLSAAGSS